MALGGGLFLTRNKTLPGTYINFVSRARPLGSLSDRGVLAMGLPLSWWGDGVCPLEVSSFQTRALELLGYNFSHEKNLYLREAFKGAKTILLYNLNKGGTKAFKVFGGFTVTAKNQGVRGNDINVFLEEDFENNTFVLSTFLDGTLLNTQKGSTLKDFENNPFVVFSGSGDLTEFSGFLEGGMDGGVTGESHTDMLEKLECEVFNTLVYAGDEPVIKSLYTEYTKRRRNDDGVKFTTVLYDFNVADFEGVISLKNKVVNTNLNFFDGVYWVAGKTAGANPNQSLTNVIYDGECEFDTSFRLSQYKNFTESGHLAFYSQRDYKKNVQETRVLQDINSFTNFSPYKNSDFSNNQVLRVLDQIATDTAYIFSKFYLGKVQNNFTGRNIFKSELINLFLELENIQAIENFKAEDISITKGTEKGDVVVNTFIFPVGAMEKLYMTVEVI